MDPPLHRMTRHYRMARWKRVLFVAIGAAMVVNGCFRLSRYPSAEGLPTAPSWPLVAIELLAIVLGTLIVVIIPSVRVTLDPDAIETRVLFWRRRLLRRDIAAKRIVRFRSTTYVLYPRSSRQRPMRIGIVFPIDATFRDWMADIPDADAVSLRARRSARANPQDSPWHPGESEH